jgi:hypothetical protein
MPLFSQARILLVCLFALIAMGDLCAQSTLIPLTTRRDMVFDHAGRYLYISTSDGFVRRYDLTTGQLEAGYNLGGALWGIDIALDDSFVLAAQHNTNGAQGTFHRVNLNTGAVTNINYARDFAEIGAWDVAIAANGLAFVTTQFDGSGTTPLRQIDLATNTISIRTDFPVIIPIGKIRQNTQIHRNVNRTRLYFLQPSSSTGPIFTYDATANAFGPLGLVGGFLEYAGGAVSPSGTMLATRRGRILSLETAPDFHLLRMVSGPDGRVAFDPDGRTLYTVDSTTDQIIAYDSATLDEKYRLDVGEDVSGGIIYQFLSDVLEISPNGRYLALSTASGVRLFTLPLSPPAPSPTPAPVFTGPQDIVFDPVHQRLYITTLKGFVWPYNLATNLLEAPYFLSGTLYGADISPDGTYLLVAQRNTGITEGALQKLDLHSGQVTYLTYPRWYLEGGSWDVAIASNGFATVTTSFNGSGSVPLRQINLLTGAVTNRTDVPTGFGGVSDSVSQDKQIHRSADRTRLYFLEANPLGYAQFTFSAVTNTFGPGNYTGVYETPSAAVSRDGSLLCSRLNETTSSLNTAPNFDRLATFANLNSGLAFDAVKDVLYGVEDSTDQIVAYDTNTFAEKFRFGAGEPVGGSAGRFGSGTLVASPDGRYLALITPTTVRVYWTGAETPAQFGNLSTRCMVETGDNVAIGGFIITGTGAKKIVLRAIGPSLTPAGIPNALPDPMLELRDSTGSVMALNDNWRDTQEAQIQSTGLAPSSELEAAIVTTVSPGTYTVIMHGKEDGTGVGLVEMYDVDPNSNARLANISTRGLVRTGDEVMIGGLIVTNPSGGVSTIREILVRAVGPSLTQFGVPNVLQDPVLELRDGNGGLLASNDNWKGAQQSSIQSTGLAPTDDREAAIRVALVPGLYTAIVRGKNDSTGVGLVEVYGLQ